MNPDPSSFRATLVAQASEPNDLERVRGTVMASLAADQKRARRHHIAAQAMWIFCALAAVYFAWFDPGMPRGLRGPFTAGFFLFYGAWEVLKQRVAAARIDVLRELKQLQLQVLQLSAVRSRDDGPQPNC